MKIRLKYANSSVDIGDHRYTNAQCVVSVIGKKMRKIPPIRNFHFLYKTNKKDKFKNLCLVKIGVLGYKNTQK